MCTRTSQASRNVRSKPRRPHWILWNFYLLAKEKDCPRKTRRRSCASSQECWNNCPKFVNCAHSIGMPSHMILKLFEATRWFRTLLATPSQTFTFPRKKRRIRGEKGNRPVHHRWRKERHERFAVHSAVLGHGNGTVFCVKASTSDFVVNHRDSRAGERTSSIGSSRFCGAASSYVRNVATRPFQRIRVTYQTQEDDEGGSWVAARAPLMNLAINLDERSARARETVNWTSSMIYEII